MRPRPAPIHVTRPADSHVTDSQLRSYDGCPRRSFYTHIVGLGGARKTTAFSRTHDCLYELLGWLADARREGDPSLEAAESAFEAIWQVRGPVDHGFATDYRRLASKLVAALVRASAGRRFRDAEPLAIDLPSGRVVVEPNEMAELPNGAVVLRRINTGYKRSDEYDRLDYALYHLAGQARFGKHYSVEALHLTDDAVEVVTITQQKLNRRRDRSSGNACRDFSRVVPTRGRSSDVSPLPTLLHLCSGPKGAIEHRLKEIGDPLPGCSFSHNYTCRGTRR